MQQHHSQPPPQTAAGIPSITPPTAAEAPPKQVALAMDRLGQAGRLIADIRLGADRLLEALIIAGQSHQSDKTLNLILKEEASMRQYLHELRAIGRQLEDSGVLNESLRSRSNSWGLHMPLVCPDGAVVAYAWKRQLAGQAGASAVDRTRLALKAFTDQKRHFFPHLDDVSGTEPVLKKHCSTQASTESHQADLSGLKTVSDVLLRLEKEAPNVKTFTYQRLDWLKRASSLLSSPSETSIESSNEHNFHNSNNLRQGSVAPVPADQIAVIELLLPSVFRVVVSLHPAGSIDPDAVAFFSPDEGGSYVHPRGFSVYNVFKHITEHAAMALQYFISINSETALNSLLVSSLTFWNLALLVTTKFLLFLCFAIAALDLLLSNPIDKSLQMDYSISRETYKRTALHMRLAAHFFGIIAVILLVVWLVMFRGAIAIDSNDNVARIFDVHPFLMFFGFIFLSGEVIMWYNTVRAEQNVQRYIHMFLNLSAIVLGIVGIHFAFKFHDRVRLGDMYTMHSWIGIATLCFFILQWLFGFSLFIFRRSSVVTRTRLMPLHVHWGRVLLYMAIITAETGLMQTQKVTKMEMMKNWESYLLNFLALAILLFGISVDISIVLSHHI